MGDEAQKRNTDCVYFLASPLTCKKGADCEYRHSEAARVNPRDCWYWLSGNCLNASCSFRHPPLDGRPTASATATPSSQVTGASSTVAPAPAAALNVPSTSIPIPTPPAASKSTVPCFFFSQGYCVKGGKCPFSHGLPTQYRKEATTYQRPQVTEHLVNGEGNGVSHAKQQFQDLKPASQVKAPMGPAQPAQEAGYVPSNVYKLSVSGATVPPGLAGQKVDHFSEVGRSKSVQNAGGMTRNSQPVESRVSQAHYSNDCVEQFPSHDKGVSRAQLSHLDPGRTTRPGRQANPAYISRSTDTFHTLEVQDAVYDFDGQQSPARELHAGDLRNLLKRKKNDPMYLSHVKDFHGKEFLKERPEIGRMSLRAVPVTDMKDFAPNNSKRAKQEKESSTFSGPKTLAQIKAEKARVAAEGNLKAADCMDDGGSEQTNAGERKGVVELASEQCVDLLQVSLRESAGVHSGMSGEESKSELKEIVCNVALEGRETSQKCNGFASDLALSASKEAFSTASPISHVGVTKSLKNEDVLVNVQEGSHPMMDYASADDAMEDGSEALENAADAEYAFDYEEDDDFARKLGRYLS